MGMASRICRYVVAGAFLFIGAQALMHQSFFAAMTAAGIGFILAAWE